MKRRLLFLLVIGFSMALPLSAWADVSIVKTADGTEFKFGMSIKFVPFTLQGLDLIDEGTNRLGAPTGNFRSFISPDTALGDQDWGILNYNNLLFTVERGPLRIHANLEIENNIDANNVDQNNVNMERFALYYKIPDWGTLGVGYDVHAFDPEGGLIYTDEHPGLWLVGGSDSLSWDVAWHYVSNCDRGVSLFSSRSSFCPTTLTGLPGGNADLDSSQNSQIFMGRVNINLGAGTTIAPMFVYYRRHVPQSELLNEFSNPTGGGFGAPTANASTSTSDQFRPAAVVKSNFGGSPVTLTAEVAGLLGQIKNVGAGFLGQSLPNTLGVAGAGPTNKNDYDLASFALFFELAYHLTPGWTTYVSFDWHKGDGNAYDDTYGGYVPISNLTAALRKDGFKGQSISSFGPAVLGASSEDGWGFDVTGRGTGPTLGSIVPDETLGVDGGTFNNRGGKGGNPGFMRVNGGVLGKINKNWDTHIGFGIYWWDQTEANVAEAAQNCVASGTFGCNGGVAGDPRNDALVQANESVISSALGDLSSKYMGFEINANIGYNINNFRIQPFFSVFIPGSSVGAIGQAFLGSATTPISDQTAFTAGVEFSAAF